MTGSPRHERTPVTSHGWWQRLYALAPWRRSLRAQMVTAFLGLTTTSLLIVAFVSYQRATTALRARLEDELSGIADANAANLASWERSQREVLSYVATSSGIIAEATVLAAALESLPPARARVTASLQALRHGPLAATEVLLYSPRGGRVVASTDSASLGTYAVDDPYYTKGRTQSYTQNIYPAPLTGRPRLTIATPVRDDRGTLQAVLAAHLDLPAMERVLRSRAGDVRVDVYVVNKFSEFIAGDRFGRRGFTRGVHSRGIDRALTRASGSGLYTNFNGVPVIGAWRWLPEMELALLVEATQAEAFLPAQRLLGLNLLTIATALVLLTLALIVAVRRITGPILGTAAAAERVARGDFTARAPEGTSDEVGRMGSAFNAMSLQLRGLVEQLNAQVDTTHAALGEAQASRILLQDIVDNAAMMVCVVDLDDIVLLVNQRFEAVFGVSQAEALGKPVALALGDGRAPELLAAIAEVKDRATTVERELVLRAQPEDHTWITVCFPLRNENTAAYAIGIIGTDLTERSRQEESRRQTDFKVQHAQKLESLGIMAGGIAHDFNNILGAVMANADMAMHHLDDPTELRSALEQITAATRRASELTRQMLAYAGKSSFRREDVDVNALVRDIVSLVRVAHSKKLHIELALSRDPVWARTDVAQLSQVVLNLVTNAAEAVGDAEGTVSVSTALSPRPQSLADAGTEASGDAPWIHLVVRDTGHGMDAATLARIYEPFFSTKQSGRGLGLAAVTGIVRSAGGQIEAESTPGRGTTFHVYLEGIATPRRESRPVSALELRAGVGTVLVVDDEAVLRRVCRRALEKSGYTVHEAVDGDDAVTVFEQHRDDINVVVLDLTMPGRSGAEVLAVIRRARPELPVIIASGYDASDGIAGVTHDEHLRFLQKPFGIEMLARAVGEMLTGR